MTECPTCGSPVRVIGRTTQHYEPVPDPRLAESDRAMANARKMVLLIEAFIYEPHRVTEAGLVAQIQRFMTGQDVEYEAEAEHD